MKLPVRYDAISYRAKRQVREQYIKLQEQRCHYCGEDIYEEPPKKYTINESLFPKGFLENPIHLHHDHMTGLTIGAVHAYCNAVLWQYHGE
tara:strand:+ start:184 stop:456 length:273 start_codon:yes stop_codon:yes gene_type:complete